MTSQSIVLSVKSTAFLNVSGSFAQNCTINGRSSGQVCKAFFLYFSSLIKTAECHIGAVHKLCKHFWGGRGSENAYRCLRGGRGAYLKCLRKHFENCLIKIETKMSSKIINTYDGKKNFIPEKDALFMARWLQEVLGNIKIWKLSKHFKTYCQLQDCFHLFCLQFWFT